ncbi:MAG: serine/threonine protein phosphatase [Oscillospiraceae bacterium]|nr:serine/threonine protein phosphatase [Oscillospiraceae bacterium]
MDEKSDDIVVSKLMDAEGRKVVCGGTTSQIVSKKTGKELMVSIDYQNPAIPPIGHIEGIDLVTEGILTLGKALEIIKNHKDASQDKWDTFTLNKKDGATLLAKMILQESTQVNFLVGRALNPAHQNPEMPISLGLKLNLIKDLAALVAEMGKKVKMEYF